MEWNKQTVRQTIRSLLLVVCGGIVFYSLVQNPARMMQALKWVLGILAPFLLGGAIAFVLNVPMRAIERHLFPKSRRGGKLRRPLALLLALVCVCGVLITASFVIGPNLRDAAMSVIRQIPAAWERTMVWLESLTVYLPQLQEYIAQWDINWNQLTAKAVSMLQTWGTGLISSGGGLIGGVVSGVSTFIIGLIFSFYILLQKEKLSRQGRQCVYALLPERRGDQALGVMTLAERTFSSFLSGQCLEAVILGTLFVIAMSIFRIPYALLVGVLISLSALIPIVGAFIGCGVGTLLIAIEDPWKALMFIVLFLVLQQIEGNLIYPNVVGSSVGLPSIWVLFAVTMGGKLMGVAGMLFFIPLCSVLYALFRGFVKLRLQNRGVPPEKWNGKSTPPDK
ncbi:MAG: AI-2E family transporter, partial [Oscillibacter sp.]